MADTAMVYSDEEKENLPVATEAKRPYWKVVEATHNLEEVLNGLSADKYHVFKVFSVPSHYTIIAHVATFKTDLPQIRKATKQIVELLQQKKDSRGNK